MWRNFSVWLDWLLSFIGPAHRRARSRWTHKLPRSDETQHKRVTNASIGSIDRYIRTVSGSIRGIKQTVDGGFSSSVSARIQQVSNVSCEPDQCFQSQSETRFTEQLESVRSFYLILILFIWFYSVCFDSVAAAVKWTWIIWFRSCTVVCYIMYINHIL